MPVLNKFILFLDIVLTAWDNIWNVYSVSNSLKIYIIFSSRLFTLVISYTEIGFCLLAPFFVAIQVDVVAAIQVEFGQQIFNDTK